jgi:hypothetical protein
MFDGKARLQCRHCWKVLAVQRVSEVLTVQMQRTPKEKENDMNKEKQKKKGGYFTTQSNTHRRKQGKLILSLRVLIAHQKGS